MEKVGYWLPIVVVVLICILKLVVNEKFSFETFKRLLVESSIDVSSLGISFMVSYIMAIANKIVLLENTQENNEKILVEYWNCFGNGFLILFIYILILVVVVFIAKFFVSKYTETEELKHIITGSIVGYMFAIPTMAYAIGLIKSIGGI